MIRRTAVWALTVAAALLTVSAFVPGAWPGLDTLAAALPLVPILAIGAIALGGRSRASAIAVLALLVSGWVIVRELADGPDGGSGAGVEMVLVTHNVSHANRDPAGTIAALESSGADILMLQETDGAIAPYLSRLRARFPYSNACTARCSLAIFSRWPIKRVRWRFRDPKGDPFGPGLIQTWVRLPSGEEAHVATLHLSRGETPGRRARIRAVLAAAVQEAGTRTLVLAGDFNLTPWGGAMRTLDAGLVPLRRATRAVFSFPAFWGGHAVLLPLAPIDHLYAGPAWRVADVHRLPKTGSDHYAIRVKLILHSPRL